MTLEPKHQAQVISVQLEDTMSDPAEPQAPTSPKTSDYYRVQPDLPARFNHPDTWRGGYRSKPGNPLYRTTNQTYGNKPPTVHEMPTTFNGVSDKFSEVATKCGMFRNHGFNTYIEKSFVTGPDNLITADDRLNFHRSYNMSGPSYSA
ncbi:piercer of microtubule wall 1 protein [Ranitomeya variabilis]|uniref:piercer of microtubule wall 1 protein n=1 Tax=Ranitomeya variabilis TaxID=490064 RepID=UPI004056D0DC